MIHRFIKSLQRITHSLQRNMSGEQDKIAHITNTTSEDFEALKLYSNKLVIDYLDGWRAVDGITELQVVEQIESYNIVDIEAPNNEKYNYTNLDTLLSQLYNDNINNENINNEEIKSDIKILYQWRFGALPVNLETFVNAWVTDTRTIKVEFANGFIYTIRIETIS